MVNELTALISKESKKPTYLRYTLLIIPLIFYYTYKINTNNIVIKSVNSSNFIHLTDIHYDPNYVEGASAHTQCHRIDGKYSQNTGKYGNLNSQCDSPKSLVLDTFQFIKKNLTGNFDFIIDTGDNARHVRDKKLKVNYNDILDDNRFVVNLYKSEFISSGIKVFPTIGNNDFSPHNKLNYRSHFYKDIKKIWSVYNLELDEYFDSLGVYNYNVNDNLNMISLNTLLFFKKNKLIKDCDHSSSPGSKQLDWLEKQLRKLPSKAIIIGHIPPKDKKGEKLYLNKCYKSYLHLMGKYSHKILGNFHGHTNVNTLSVLVKKKDDFELITISENEKIDVDPSDIIGNFNNGASIIPVHNPSFRLYSVHSNTESSKKLDKILTFEEYSTDLNHANELGYLHYKIREDLNDF